MFCGTNYYILRSTTSGSSRALVSESPIFLMESMNAASLCPGTFVGPPFCFLHLYWCKQSFNTSSLLCALEKRSNQLVKYLKLCLSRFVFFLFLIHWLDLPKCIQPPTPGRLPVNGCFVWGPWSVRIWLLANIWWDDCCSFALVNYNVWGSLWTLFTVNMWQTSAQHTHTHNK